MFTKTLPPIPHPDKASAPIPLRPSSKALLLLFVVALILITAFELAAPGSRQDKPLFVDFNDFHLVGDYIREGNPAGVYDFSGFHARQAELAGEGIFMPWTYPAQFNLLLAPLGYLEVWLAYLLFISASFAAYALVLRKLAGEQVFAVFVFVFPAILVTIRSGQNGFLTGALIGAFCLLSLGKRASAGTRQSTPHKPRSNRSETGKRKAPRGALSDPV
ncbi:glycosyltransferase family 87 protein [Thioclava sp. A2]|uniref:glycosyltransferase family 87 protein n=1 Tax=Thioclava sp. FCG-A2 TaxID=3080562 RepID=UPI0029549679|nr:glycosyltransferase family 87 protein [Thioclava sp. A2]